MYIVRHEKNIYKILLLSFKNKAFKKIAEKIIYIKNHLRSLNDLKNYNIHIM